MIPENELIIYKVAKYKDLFLSSVKIVSDCSYLAWKLRYCRLEIYTRIYGTEKLMSQNLGALWKFLFPPIQLKWGLNSGIISTVQPHYPDLCYIWILPLSSLQLKIPKSLISTVLTSLIQISPLSGYKLFVPRRPDQWGCTVVAEMHVW